MIVDRVDFTYDALGAIDKFNIRPQLINDPERLHIEIRGNGEIGTLKRDSIAFHDYKSAGVLQKYAIVARVMRHL